MAACDAEPLGLGLEDPSPTVAQETLNAELGNLTLKSDAQSAENESSVEEKLEPPSKENSADGWGSDREDEKSVKSSEPSGEVKADGWGSDQDFSPPDENQQSEKYQELSNEDKDDVWGWGAQETGGNEENVKFKQEKGERMRSPLFPVRPNEPDCTFYVKTGNCRFGMNCKFNHPANKTRNMAVELNENKASPEMVGQTHREKANKGWKGGTLSETSEQFDCKFYSMPGGCKFGSACKYNHKEKLEVPAELNFLGLPKRPGEKECMYYMSTGSCKFSTNCRFHHPDPVVVGAQDHSSRHQNGGSTQLRTPTQLPMTSWPNKAVPYLEPPFLSGYFLPPQGLHPNPEWNGYQAPVHPLFPAEMNMYHPPASVLEGIARKGNGFAPRRPSNDDYPERPGQPECQFFMKTGGCKFKSACKFHHPKSRVPTTSGISVRPNGPPFRPDQAVCTHYSRHGICKYGGACRYNHSMDCNPSISLAEGTESAQNILPENDVKSQEVKPESAW